MGEVKGCMILSGETKKRYGAFWEGGAYGRCCLYLTAPSGANSAGRPVPADVAQAWEDLDLRTQIALWDAENTLYYADGFPSVFTNFGPGCLAAMIGGTYRWARDTVWFENEPVITDWEGAPAPVLDRESAMYRLADTLTEKLMAAGEGRFFTSVTDIGGTYDILAALRGTQALLLDLYEHPKEVLAYAERLRPVWIEYFRQYAERAIARQGGMTSWMPIWSDKPWYPLQCDFSAMISPEMFGEFILPGLRYYTERIDRSVYHLDGPGELPHVRHLLSLPRLSAIQWTPGSGNEDVGHERWFGLYEEIQAAGKGLVLLGVHPEELERLLRHVSTKGLYVSCGAGAGDAKELIRMADGYGVK